MDSFRNYLTIVPLGLLSLMASSECYAQISTPDKEVNDSTGEIYKELDDLVIVAKKPVVKSDGATLEYNLDEDKSSSGLSLLDALKKVPMITVDGEDNIYLKGERNFKIYVNGREDPTLTQYASRILKAMPASSVSKIEVITEPGAKFDAEGVAGVINLVTMRKQTANGYNGSLNASLSNREVGLSGYAMGKINRFSVDASLGYSQTAFEKQINETTIENINKTAGGLRQVQHMRNESSYNYVDARINTSWNPTDKNLFNFNAHVMNMHAKVPGIPLEMNMYDAGSSLISSYSQRLKAEIFNKNVDATAAYQHDFDDKGHRINFSYRFDFGRNPFNLYTTNRESYNYEFMSPYESSLSTTYDRAHTMQVDYVNPFGGNTHLLETGFKALWRNNMTDQSNIFSKYEDSDFIDEKDTDMTQRQNIYALYVSYRFILNKFNGKVGLRDELTDYSLHFRQDPAQNFSGHYNNLVPNAALTYMFGMTTNLRLAYQMRISRPSISQLSPFEMRLGNYNVRTGNPDLKSEKNNTISLTFTSFGRIFGGNIGIEYSNTANSIQSMSYFEGQTEYQTYANIGRTQSIAMNGFLSATLSQKFNISVNGRISYNHLKAQFTGNHGWSGNYGANMNYTLPGEVRLGAYGGQTVHIITLQGYYSGWYYYGLSASRDFLRTKALSVTLSASNFFTNFTHFNSYLSTPDYTQTSHSKSKNWRVGVSIAWKFGNLAEKMKKTASEITNDDTSTTKTGTNGGGL